MFDYLNFIGYTAGVTNAIAMIPQIIKLIKTKKSNDISILTFIMLFITSILWIVFGIIISSISIIVSSSIGFCLTLTISILTFIYYKKQTECLELVN